MSRRERTLALILGVAAAAGILYGAWAAVVDPLLKKQAQVRELRAENATNQGVADDTRHRNQRLQQEVYKRSLPADMDIAKQEYATAIRRILSEAKVPAGYVFADKPADMKNVPMIAKGKPYYAKLAFTITIAKTDVSTFVVFLKKFYDMNLLHQVTHFTLKREDVPSLAFDTRQPDKRKDLTATIDIEAISLDGVPARRTLFPAPTGTGALMGGLGLYTLQNTAVEVARGIKPQQVVRLLASPDRAYGDVVAHDVFHGLVPAPVVIPPVVVGGGKVEPPKPDLSEFIRFNKLIRSTEGVSWIGLYDVSVNMYYAISVAPRGEKQVVRVQRTVGAPQSQPTEKNPPLPPENWLEVNNPDSRGNRRFWVYGVDGDALLLGERDTPPAAAVAPAAPPKAVGGGKGNKSGSTKAAVPALPALVVDPKAAVLGGIVAIGPKPERFFLWSYGRSMKDVKELTKAEADVIIRRIQGVSPSLDKPPEPAAPPVPAEVAPQPREVAAGAEVPM